MTSIWILLPRGDVNLNIHLEGMLSLGVTATIPGYWVLDPADLGCCCRDQGYTAPLTHQFHFWEAVK